MKTANVSAIAPRTRLTLIGFVPLSSNLPATNNLPPTTYQLIYTSRMKHILLVALLAVPSLLAQTPAAPVNDAPNPYKTVGNPFQLPEGRVWGSISTVEPDIDGKSIWIADRCGANSCAGSNLPVVMKFDASGKLVRASARHVRLPARHSCRRAG